jgi:tetratricopeptide (TPR) repeat protein
MALTATTYQAQGNLQEAAKFLKEVNAQTPSATAFAIKLTQLRLERSHGEAVQLMQARQTQIPFNSALEKGAVQAYLAFVQHLARDSAGAIATAEQARNTLEALYKDQQDNQNLAQALSLSYAVIGNKDSALKEAERAIMLLPSANDPVQGPSYEESLALIQTMFGENSRAISTLARLLETPCEAFLYIETPITPALLRLDPAWDPLRGDRVFQKLCEEKKP